VFGFPFELHNLNDIKIPAEEHKPINRQHFERRGYLIKCIRPFMLILDGESAVMFEDYF
jgi:hypothetical protein